MSLPEFKKDVYDTGPLPDIFITTPDIPPVIGGDWSHLNVDPIIFVPNIPSVIHLETEGKAEVPLEISEANAGTIEEFIKKTIAKGDCVDPESMPFPNKTWNPDPSNKVVRCFSGKWRSDDDYELVNYCIFPSHFELELRS